jgi:hypothetical protein
MSAISKVIETAIPNICANTECNHDQCMYFHEYWKQNDKMKSLQDQLDILSFETKTKVSHLEIQVSQYKEMLLHQETINNALQGKISSTLYHIPDTVYPTCSGCVHHRNALIHSRAMISSSYSGVQARTQEVERILNVAKADLASERLINGKLRVCINAMQMQISQMKNLEKENEQYTQKIQVFNAQLKEAGQLIAVLKQEMTVLKEQSTSPDSSNCKAQKRGHHEIRSHVQLTGHLKSVLSNVFSVSKNNNNQLCENDLYDAFLSSIHESQRALCLDAIYTACHNGEPPSARERKKILEGKGRACKSSFSVCLEAMGGVVIKNGTQNIWTNIQINNPR